MNVTIETLSELRVAGVRHVGPYSEVGEAFGRLTALAGPAGLLRPDAYLLAVFLDDPREVPAAELRSDACVTLVSSAPLPEGLTETRIAAGRYASTTHRGPFSGLPDAWSRLMGEWLPQSGEQMDKRPSFEVYRTVDMSRPEDLVTELHLPLAAL
jgi:AraC family transcriptional regulator